MKQTLKTAYVISLILLLTACGVVTPAPTVMPTATAMSTFTPTLTAVPTNTPTAISTLSVEQARAELLDLLATNGDCRLPCLWGWEKYLSRSAGCHGPAQQYLSVNKL